MISAYIHVAYILLHAELHRLDKDEFDNLVVRED